MMKETFRVLVQPEWIGEDRWWVAQCLEYDITAQAKTLDDLEYQLQRELVGRIAVSEKLGVEPFKGLPQAPDRYWRLFNEARRVETKGSRAFRQAATDGPATWVPGPDYEARVA